MKNSHQDSQPRVNTGNDSGHDAWSRRGFLRAAGAAGLACCLPTPGASLLASVVPGANDRRLVLVFLEGGNDGLNTVVPVEDDAYHRARPRLRLAGKSLHRLDDLTALHPSLGGWARLFHEGQLSVLQCVGHDQPDRSHFVSRDIWHTGRLEPGPHPLGWVGRALDGQSTDRLPAVALGAEEAPLLLRGRQGVGLTLSSLDRVRLELADGARAQQALAAGASGARASTARAASRHALAGRIGRVATDSYRLSNELEALLARVPAGDGYPQNALGERLRLAARLIRAPAGPAVLWTQLGGFDTHAVQPGTHAALLQQLNDASTAFLADLASDGSQERTLVLVYSEFGRRVRENGSAGTDHGAAAPVFALGGGVKGGLVGDAPDLVDLSEGDVSARIDFRAVFAEAAQRWMGWDTEGLFDRSLPALAYLG